ncbi:glutamate racemase [Peptoniphilus catoniae]|uniref:glutamate racemase n=1 Tax=Peptoniphilus catoniae TaxID=1660341 RepID=UPI0010FE3730|nr:glutamate racemase [Peptoniphilus catoniae]
MNFLNDRPIGIFDSGIGGLSILKELKEDFPNEDFIYIADTGRAAYGAEGSQDISKYTMECFKKLETMDVKLAIMACNISVPYCIDEIKKEFNFPTLAVMGSGIVDSAMITNNRKVLILAGDATARTDIFQKAMAKIDSRVDTRVTGCPDLISAVKDGLGEERQGYLAAKGEMDKYSDFDYDILLLGCTYFLFAQNNIQKILKDQDKNAKIVNPAKSISGDLNRMLSGLKILSDKKGQKISCYVTGDVDDFKTVSMKLMGEDYKDLHIFKMDFED